MKTFILASAIFLLILIFVITSSVFLVKTGRELKSIADEFPPDLPSEEVTFKNVMNKFKKEFEKNRFFIHLIIGHSENESIDNAINDIEARQ